MSYYVTERKCRICGASLWSKRYDSKTCSDICRKKLSRLKTNLKRDGERLANAVRRYAEHATDSDQDLAAIAKGYLAQMVSAAEIPVTIAADTPTLQRNRDIPEGHNLPGISVPSQAVTAKAGAINGASPQSRFSPDANVSQSLVTATSSMTDVTAAAVTGSAADGVQ